MFEDALYTALTGSGDLATRLNTYNGQPAVFSDVAPKDAERPYVVFTIDREEDDNPGVDVFTVDVDYYEYGMSRKTAREVVQIIEFLLDPKSLTNDRYAPIRFYKPSSSEVRESDPKAIHYNMQFDVRAGRKAWMAQLN